MMRVKDDAKGKRVVARLQKKVQDRKVKEDLAEIPGALEVLKNLQKEVNAFEERMRTVESRTATLWDERNQGIIKKGWKEEEDAI